MGWEAGWEANVTVVDASALSLLLTPAAMKSAQQIHHASMSCGAAVRAVCLAVL
jgi:hypothetical protein